MWIGMRSGKVWSGHLLGVVKMCCVTRLWKCLDALDHLFISINVLSRINIFSILSNVVCPSVPCL